MKREFKKGYAPDFFLRKLSPDEFPGAPCLQ